MSETASAAHPGTRVTLLTLPEPLQQLNLAGVIQIVRSGTGDEREALSALPSMLLVQAARGPAPPRSHAATGASRAATRDRFATPSRWSPASGDGRRNQFEPSSGNAPRGARASRRQAAYFQYAAWTTSSQTLCRPAAGPPRGLPRRHAANRAAQVGAVPRTVVVRLVEDGQELPDFAWLCQAAILTSVQLEAHRYLPSTRSAPSKLLRFVRSVGTTMQPMPAALADSRPRAESSMATHASGEKPLRSTARRYGSGSGLTRVKSLAVSTKSKYFSSPVSRWMTSK